MQVLPHGADGVTGETARTVAAEDGVGPQVLLLVAAVATKGDPDRARRIVRSVGVPCDGLGDGHNLHSAPQLALRAARQGVTQQAFQLGLVEHAGLREAVVSVHGPREFGDHAAPGVQQPQSGRRAGEGGELLVDTGALQDPADLIVHDDGARQG